jgi:hypothetical protein
MKFNTNNIGKCQQKSEEKDTYQNFNIMQISDKKTINL